MATFNTSKYSPFNKLDKDIKAGKYTSKKEPAKYIFETNKRGRRVKKLNPRWTAWSKKQKNKTTKTVENKTQKAPKRLSKEERTKHEKIAKNEKLKIKKTEANKKGEQKAKGATTTGGPVKDNVKYAKSKGDDLAGYRRGPGTKLGKDTRITKKLKKSGFTEDRLARLRKKNAEFQAAKKDKKKMKAYRAKYGK